MPRVNRKQKRLSKTQLATISAWDKKIFRGLDRELIRYQAYGSVRLQYRIGKKYPVGTKGTIIYVYNEYMYEVEFFDESNNTIGTKRVHWTDIKLN